MLTTNIPSRSAPAVALSKSRQPARGAAENTTAAQPGTTRSAFQTLLENQAPAKTTSATMTSSRPAAAADDTISTKVPTAEALFGAHPWLENPTGSAPNGQTWSYNPLYFSTRQTAEAVANMVGGTVIEQKQICPTGPLVQNQPNEMVQLANGRIINAGQFASIFTHGYPQSFVDRLVQQELSGGTT